MRFLKKCSSFHMDHKDSFLYWRLASGSAPLLAGGSPPRVFPSAPSWLTALWELGRLSAVKHGCCAACQPLDKAPQQHTEEHVWTLGLLWLNIVFIYFTPPPTTSPCGLTLTPGQQLYHGVGKSSFESQDIAADDDDVQVGWVEVALDTFFCKSNRLQGRVIKKLKKRGGGNIHMDTF